MHRDGKGSNPMLIYLSIYLGIAKEHNLPRVDFPTFCAYCTSYTDLHPNRNRKKGQKFI